MQVTLIVKYNITCKINCKQTLYIYIKYVLHIKSEYCQSH